jgi:predicted SAM-dependent methyltransferase
MTTKEAPRSFLNIAGGKILPINFKENYNDFLLNVDTSYYDTNNGQAVESGFEMWARGIKDYHKPVNYLNSDIFDFMERTICVFGEVSCYRFLEHVPRDKVLYFIYLVSTVLDKGGLFDIIVPDYKKLADMILDDKPGEEDFPERNILLSTELLNEPESPHCSIWTVDRLIYFLQLEERFVIRHIDKNVEFDGRNIYLRCLAERV